MKILYIIDSLKLGGKEKQLYYLIKSLKARYSVEAYLFVKKDINDYPGIISYCKKIYSADGKPYMLLKKINEIISEIKPDIIHTLEGGLTSITIPAAKYNRVKLINGEIRYAKKFNSLSKLGIMQKFNTSFSDLNISNSEAGLKAFSLEKNSRNIVIHNGFDIEDFDRKRLPDNDYIKLTNDKPFIIGKIANFTKPKDYLSIIKAGVILLKKYDNLRFVFAGDGPERDAAMNAVPGELSDKFLFLGRRDDAESLVKVFDICLLLSKKDHSEGLSNSIMEYMAAGKPVIATEVGGNSELVIKGKTGFLIESEDVEALVKKIEFLIDNPDERLKMGEAGRKRIINEFGIDVMAERYMDLYTKLQQE